MVSDLDQVSIESGLRQTGVLTTIQYNYTIANTFFFLSIKQHYQQPQQQQITKHTLTQKETDTRLFSRKISYERLCMCVCATQNAVIIYLAWTASSLLSSLPSFSIKRPEHMHII